MEKSGGANDGSPGNTTSKNPVRLRGRAGGEIMEETITPEAGFLLSPQIRSALTMMGEFFTPLQQEILRVAFRGDNVLARAKSGSGKTVAFSISVLEKVNTETDSLQALILVPTRELGLHTLQICNDLSKNYQPKMIVTLATDSTKKLHNPQAYFGSHAMIATPRSVLYLLEKDYCYLNHCKMLVLDDADKLFSQNHDYKIMLSKLISVLPYDRQILVLSEDFPDALLSFMKLYWKPSIKSIQLHKLTLEWVTQYYEMIEHNESDKLGHLKKLITELDIDTKNSIIFCSTGARAEMVAAMMEDNMQKKVGKWGVLTASMKKGEKRVVLDKFRRTEFRYLICSTVFTQGVGPEVNVIYNYDFPNLCSIYEHNVGSRGKTLRIAINLIEHDDVFNLKKFEKELRTIIKPIPRSINKAFFVAR